MRLMIVLLVVESSLPPEETGFLGIMEMAFVSSISTDGLVVDKRGIIHSTCSLPGKPQIMAIWMPMQVLPVIMCLVCGHGWTVKCMKPAVLNLIIHTLHPAKFVLVLMIMIMSVVLQKWVNSFFTKVCFPIPTDKKIEGYLGKKWGIYHGLRPSHTPMLILTWIRVFPKLPRIVSAVLLEHPLSTPWRQLVPPLGLGFGRAPNWLSINSTSGQVSGTPPSIGSYPITFSLLPMRLVLRRASGPPPLL